MNEPQAGGTTPPAKVPVFMVGNDDGTAIRKMIEKKESPKIQIRLAVEMRTGLKTANVWCVLPGATDEQIAIMAHTDSFFEGAMDNASGVATLVAMAEHYASIPEGPAEADDHVLHNVGPSFAVRPGRGRAVGPYQPMFAPIIRRPARTRACSGSIPT